MAKKPSKRRPVFIFDIGGVVIIWRNNDSIFRCIAKRYHIPFTRMRDIMNGILGDLETGRISCRQFVVKALEHFGKSLRPRDNPSSLITYPFVSQAKPRKGVIRIIKSLQGQGYEVDGLSNTNWTHVRVMNKQGWGDTLFDHFFPSCSIRSTKPSFSAYKKVLRSLGVDPEDVVFIDNTERNVLGARDAGIRHSIRFDSIARLKKEIRKILQEYSE